MVAQQPFNSAIKVSAAPIMLQVNQKWLNRINLSQEH